MDFKYPLAFAKYRRYYSLLVSHKQKPNQNKEARLNSTGIICIYMMTTPTLLYWHNPRGIIVTDILDMACGDVSGEIFHYTWRVP